MTTAVLKKTGNQKIKTGRPGHQPVGEPRHAPAGAAPRHAPACRHHRRPAGGRGRGESDPALTPQTSGRSIRLWHVGAPDRPVATVPTPRGIENNRWRLAQDASPESLTWRSRLHRLTARASPA